jgi:hypothetical protein
MEELWKIIDTLNFLKIHSKAQRISFSIDDTDIPFKIEFRSVINDKVYTMTKEIAYTNISKFMISAKEYLLNLCTKWQSELERKLAEDING